MSQHLPPRSLFYVPAHKKEWVETAPMKFNADAIIFDLEDAVPFSKKQEARETLRNSYEEFNDEDTLIFSRINGPETEYIEDDLDEIVYPGLDAVIVPKTATADQIKRIDNILTFLENKRDMKNPVEVIPLLEEAEGMYHPLEIARSSDRNKALGAPAGPEADSTRALGFEWTGEGTEVLHMRSKIVMAARAAGLNEVITAGHLEVENIGGLKKDAMNAQELGFTGYQVIHPDHIDVVNDIFSLSREKKERYKEILEAMDEVEAEKGDAAVEYEGQMVDIAHVRYAEKMLERAEQFDK